MIDGRGLREVVGAKTENRLIGDVLPNFGQPVRGSRTSLHELLDVRRESRRA